MCRRMQNINWHEILHMLRERYRYQYCCWGNAAGHVTNVFLIKDISHPSRPTNYWSQWYYSWPILPDPRTEMHVHTERQAALLLFGRKISCVTSYAVKESCWWYRRFGNSVAESSSRGPHPCRGVPGVIGHNTWIGLPWTQITPMNNLKSKYNPFAPCALVFAISSTAWQGKWTWTCPKLVLQTSCHRPLKKDSVETKGSFLSNIYTERLGHLPKSRPCRTLMSLQ